MRELCKKLFAAQWTTTPSLGSKDLEIIYTIQNRHPKFEGELAIPFSIPKTTDKSNIPRKATTIPGRNGFG